MALTMPRFPAPAGSLAAASQAPADPSRRALIGGAGVAALLAAVPAFAKAAGHPHAIEQHWQDRCRAYREFEADPEALEDDDRADGYWERITAHEEAILASPDVSARASEVRLWVAWSHAHPSFRAGRVAEFVQQGDVRSLLTIRDGLDVHEKLIFAAILNLRGEG